jgi:hypothetical protein
MMRGLALSLALLVGGCVAPQFPAPDASWKTYSGQLQYANRERSVIGEFTASGRGNDFHLEYSKGGTVPLMRVAVHAGYARADGPLARGRWTGTVEKAPPALQGWVSEVPRAFAGLEPIMKAAQFPVGSARRVQVRGATADEKFLFILNR